GAMKADIAYCPRSRTYFGHPIFKLADIVAAGCNVCLGTDSRASNWNLNLFEEMRHMRKEQPNADARLLWANATLNGRKVLSRALPGVPADVTTWADLNIVQWKGGEVSLDALIEACPPTAATIIGGEIAYRR
ncbi:MAG: amidohydrolase family protein, partial [Planctomycetes bacterium]|nr:amidohydrolase family protein [Planctomycetota bacterium]